MNAAPRASSFVTVMAQVSLVLGIAGTVYALVQLLTVELLLRGDVADAIAQLPLEHLPSAMGWLMAHLRAIAWMFLAASVGFLLASWGLLRRRTWGWWAFVGFMVLGALVNFAGIALVEHLFDWLQSIRQAADMPDLVFDLQALRRSLLFTMWGTALVFAVLHGMIVWKLCAPEIRAEFGAPPARR